MTVVTPQRENRIDWLLPLPGWPRAQFESDFAYQGGRLVRDGVTLLSARTRADLERGVRGTPVGQRVELCMRLKPGALRPSLEVYANGIAAQREDALRASPSRSAWIHAGQALAGSAAGFIASHLYLENAALVGSEWALKMGRHMAGWHLLLTLTLFPASVWGQRKGIRAVQLVSLLFFAIHGGIAWSNVGSAMPGDSTDMQIALWNAVSGVFFLVCALYGQRAFRDMDPVAAWRRGDRVRLPRGGEDIASTQKRRRKFGNARPHRAARDAERELLRDRV